MDSGFLSKHRIALGLGTLSALQLGLELLFIKLSRYQFATLSLGVIGLAILGVALAGPLASALGGNDRAMRRATLAVLPTGLIAGIVLFALPHRWLGDAKTNLLILACGIVCLVPLALCSVPVYTAMRREHESVHAYYAASLAGATLGAPLGFGFMEIGGDLVAYVAVLALSIPATLLLLGEHRLQRIGALFASLIVAASAWLLPWIDQAAHPESDYVRTNGFSRIDVVRDPQTDELWIRTAGINAGTGLPGGSVEQPSWDLLTELSARAFASSPERVLILGSGAGRNVVQALAMGAEEVVAVEINGMIPDYMREALDPEDDPYRDPRVRLIVAEGRDAAARIGVEASGKERFDLVYVPIATLFGSSGHAFTQTYLMTREAIASYCRLLAPGGRVAVYAVDDFRPKVAQAMAEALRDLGTTEPAKHMAVLHEPGWFLMVGRPDTPVGPLEGRFSEGERYSPSRLDVEEEVAAGEKIRALTDDNPFLRNHILAVEGEWGAYGWNLGFLRQAFRISLILLIAAAVVGVLRAGQGARLGRVAYLAAFAAMGIGYTAFQTVVIQRLAFLVGHPLLATAIVLPCTLLGTAAGSYWSRRLKGEALTHARIMTTIGLVVFITALATLPPSELSVPSWSFGTRIGVAVLISFLPFVVMGTFFPVVFARAQLEDTGALPFGWLLNGIGAVAGSVLAIFGPTMFGFRSMFLFVAILYLSLASWDVLCRGSSRSLANRGLTAVFILILGAVLGMLEVEVAAVSPF